MTLNGIPMGGTLTEIGGLAIVPALIRTPHGWIEQAPNRCGSCKGTRLLIGWTACSCRSDTLCTDTEPGNATTVDNTSASDASDDAAQSRTDGGIRLHPPYQ